MDDARLLDAELHLAALGRLDRLARRWASPCPSFGFGIRPRGPRILPSRPTSGIMSGVAMQRSKSILPAWIFSARSSAPTTSAPAARASSALSPRGEHGDAQGLAGAVRQVDRAAHHLVGVTRIDAQVERQLDRLVELRLGVVLDQLHRLGQRVQLVAIDRRHRPPSAACPCLPSSYSTTSRPIERAEPTIICAAAVDVVGVQVLHLRLGDLAALGDGDLAGDSAAAGASALPLLTLAAFLRK